MQQVRLIVAAASAALAGSVAVIDPAAATFPGRNGDIVYSDTWGSDVETNTDVYRVCPDGSPERRLVGRHADVGGVSFSPDGRLVAFDWSPYYQGRDRVYLAAAYAKRADRQISRPPPGKEDFGPVWSPRGGAIAFTRAPRSGRRGATVRIYSRGHGRYLARGWGPDWSVRNRIAFTRGDRFDPSGDPPSKVSVVPARGGDVRELAAGWNPRWSPDGRRLVYSTTTPSGLSAVALMSANGSGQHVLALGTAAVWAPDGRHLAFVTHEGRTAVVTFPGERVRFLRRSSGFPVFSPDGKWVTVSRGSDLYIVRVDGTRMEYVTTAPSLEFLSVVDWRRLPPGAGCG